MLSHPDIIRNKYYMWYKQLITAARNVEENYEVHHILPKCMGGRDDKSNLVRLTYREHYIAHKLLWKCTTGITKQKMAYALVLMKVRPGVSITSRQFNLIKKDCNKYRSDTRKGMFVAIDDAGNTFLVSNTDERYLSGELVAESKGRLLGRKFTEEHKRNLATSKQGRSNPNHKWLITTPLGTYESLGAAAAAHNTSRTTVLNRCNSPQFPQWVKLPCRTQASNIQELPTEV